MTPKQERFCEEYLVDLNATQAAIRAGYSQKTAQEIGAQNLSKLIISEKIAALMSQRSERTRITADMVLEELRYIAFSRMRRVMKWGPGGVKLLDSDELSEADEAAVSEVSQTITKDGGRIALKLHDKSKALEMIGRHIGMFDPDNAEEFDEGVTFA